MKRFVSIMLLGVLLFTTAVGFAISPESIEMYKRLDLQYKSEGYSLFNQGLAVVSTEDGWNYMNENYELVDLNKGRFVNVFAFSEGLGAVIDHDFKLGFINKEGEIVIPCQYGAFYAQGGTFAPYFKDGVANVLDKDYHLKSSFNYTGENSDSMDVVYEEQEMLVIQIDKNGNKLGENLEKRVNIDGLNSVSDGGIIREFVKEEDLTGASHWAKADVEAARSLDLLTPATSKNFKNHISRLEFAELIVGLTEKSLGKEIEVPRENVFSDTENVDVLKAYGAGIINGTGPNTFNPNSLITREQIATMLYNTIIYIESENSREYLVKDSDISNYKDSEKVSSWAKTGVGVLANNEVMMGTSDSELSPKENTSIEQSLILVYRLYNRISN